MPRKFMFTKEEVIEAALALSRDKGISAVTARAIGEKLGSSSKPIFSLFENMDEVVHEVLEASNKVYQSYLEQEMTKGNYPPYKASGMGYIRFAKEEKELFKILFMRDRSNEIMDNNNEIMPLIKLIQKNLGLSEDEATLFHSEMWFYVHGIATTIATSYLEWNEEIISKILTDGYEGLKCRYKGDE
ncbi:TetR/AcrR family transcriptional regulator [Anaerorhabdus sp.]|uniref:TetR/AcrR family transcriptional regulator n=1 Tax=Anaerorhabdus sp. TaxID=1872524 RepID=UPI002FC846B8